MSEDLKLKEKKKHDNWVNPVLAWSIFFVAVAVVVVIGYIAFTNAAK